MLLLGLLAAASWMLYTPSGSAWLMTRIVSTLDGEIGAVEGTLGGRLKLTGLRVERPDGLLELGKLDVSTQLQQLLPLRLKIDRLQLERLYINPQPSQLSQQPVALDWPQLPWWLKLVEIDLNQLELNDIQLRQQDEELFLIKRLQGQVAWRDQSLALTWFNLQTSELESEGRLLLDLADPALIADVELRQAGSDQVWQQLKLHADLKADEKRLLAGPINFALSENDSILVKVDGEVGLEGAELRFKALKFQRPGRHGSLTASGALNFTSSEFGFNSRLQLSEVDLEVETGQSIMLSGAVEINGSPDSYRGHFELFNRVPQPFDLQLSGILSGGLQGLQLSHLKGLWLNGSIGGQAQIDWRNGWFFKAKIRGRGFDPQLVHEQLNGTVNLDLDVELKTVTTGLSGGVSMRLQQSLLHGQPVSGTAELRLDHQQLEITGLQLYGDGIEVQAKGKLEQQIDMVWRIERLEQLLPDWHGELSGKGRLQGKPEQLSVSFSTQGSGLAYKGWQLARWQLEGEVGEDQRWQLNIGGQQLSTPPEGFKVDNFTLGAVGDLKQHEIQLKLIQDSASLEAILSGGWDNQRWSGRLERLVGNDAQLGQWQALAPAHLSLSADRLQLERLDITSASQGSIQLQGDFYLSGQQGEGNFIWQQIDLSLFQPWLSGWQLSGRSTGSASLQLAEEQSFHGNMSLSGQLGNESLALNFKNGKTQVDWDNQGLKVALELQLADGSQLEGTLSAPQKFALAWPEQGDLQVQGRNFSLERGQAWLPAGLKLSGLIDWQSSAHWQIGQPWMVEGNASIADGGFSWQEDDETISADLSSATLHWSWQERLEAALELQLHEHGTVDAHFELPVAAVFPLKFDRAALISGELNGRLQELGLLSILFPGRVQKSHGQLKLDLKLGGSWERPDLRGDVRLFDAGAFLPTLGIHVDRAELFCSFDENRIELKTLQLSSADGSLDGQGNITLKGWQPQDYSLLFSGQRFELVNLPEIQFRISPDLRISGGMNSYQVRGSLTVPELSINKRKKASTVENSPDLLIVDADVPPQHQFRLKHDIDVQLILGEQVLLNSFGIDARLEGRIRVESDPRQELVAVGKINVVKGKYASYGISLDITRGNLLFSGGPIAQPSLDILALRKAGDVQAGVKVTGTPKRPLVQLYSEPVMAETDILSYIVLGREIGAGGSQEGLLMTAAGALLSQGESVALQEKLKSRLGLDVLDINAGDGDVTSSIITTGKYLTPDLYISLGYSLFDQNNEVKVRYNLTPDWEIESNIGTESGVDLFYKIDIE